MSNSYPQRHYLQQQPEHQGDYSSFASYTTTPTRPPANFREERRWSNTHGVSAELDPSPPSRTNAYSKTRSREHANHNNYDHPFLSLRLPSSPPSFTETLPTAQYYQEQQVKGEEPDVRPPTGGNYAPLFSPEKDNASEISVSVHNDQPQFPSNGNAVNDCYGADVTFDRYTDDDSRIVRFGHDDIDDQVFADLLAKVNEALGNVVSEGSNEAKSCLEENLSEYALLRKVDEILKPCSTESFVQTSTWTDRCTTSEDSIGGMIGASRSDHDSHRSPFAKSVPSSDGFLQSPFMDEPPPPTHAKPPVTRYSASTPLPALPSSAAEFLLPKINYVSFIGDNETLMESALEPLMQKYILPASGPPYIPPSSPNPALLPAIGHKRAEEVRRSTVPRGEQTTIAFEDQLSVASLDYMKRHNLLRTKPAPGNRESASRRVYGPKSETLRSGQTVHRTSPLRVSSMPDDVDEDNYCQGRKGVADRDYANEDVLDLERLKRLPKLLG